MAGSNSSTPGVSLRAVKFAFYSPDSVSQGIPVQQAASPEFPVLNSTTIAYPLSILQRNPKVSIHCLLKKALAAGERNNDSWATLQVKFQASESVPSSPPTALMVEPFEFIFKASPQKDKPQFSSQNNQAGFMPLELDLSPVLAQLNAVGQTSFYMRWEWRPGAADEPGDFQEIGTFPFTVYFTLDQLNRPWGWPNEGGSVPTVSLIRHACEWTSGSTDPQDSLAKIVMSIWKLTTFQYSLNRAYTSYPTDENGLPVILDGKTSIVVDATAMSDHLHGWYGDGLQVNCADISHLVMLLGNILGCNVNVGILANPHSPKSGFALNPHWALGANQLQTSQPFLFHEVAYLGDTFNEDAIIFDPCLAFGVDKPTDFVAGWKLSDYLKKLVVDEKSCAPMPGLKAWDIKVI